MLQLLDDPLVFILWDSTVRVPCYANQIRSLPAERVGERSPGNPPYKQLRSPYSVWFKFGSLRVSCGLSTRMHSSTASARNRLLVIHAYLACSSSSASPALLHLGSPVSILPGLVPFHQKHTRFWLTLKPESGNCLSPLSASPQALLLSWSQLLPGQESFTLPSQPQCEICCGGNIHTLEISSELIWGSDLLPASSVQGGSNRGTGKLIPKVMLSSCSYPVSSHLGQAAAVSLLLKAVLPDGSC